jgi:hypothetical protein
MEAIDVSSLITTVGVILFSCLGISILILLGGFFK